MARLRRRFGCVDQSQELDRRVLECLGARQQPIGRGKTCARRSFRRGRYRARRATVGPFQTLGRRRRRRCRCRCRDGVPSCLRVEAAKPSAALASKFCSDVSLSSACRAASSSAHSPMSTSAARTGSTSESRAEIATSAMATPAAPRRCESADSTALFVLRRPCTRRRLRARQPPQVRHLRRPRDLAGCCGDRIGGTARGRGVAGDHHQLGSAAIALWRNSRFAARQVHEEPMELALASPAAPMVR